MNEKKTEKMLFVGFVFFFVSKIFKRLIFWTLI